jgi:hypothetical protein
MTKDSKEFSVLMSAIKHLEKASEIISRANIKRPKHGSSQDPKDTLRETLSDFYDIVIETIGPQCVDDVRSLPESMRTEALCHLLYPLSSKTWCPDGYCELLEENNSYLARSAIQNLAINTPNQLVEFLDAQWEVIHKIDASI